MLRKGELTKEHRKPLKEWASLYGIRLLESAGLEVVYDGEQQRSEMYAAAVALADGFEFLGTVRSFDNKYYNKARLDEGTFPRRRVRVSSRPGVV